MRTTRTIAVVVSTGLVTAALGQTPGTEFSYQGRLMHDGKPANGAYNLTFSLWNAASGGSAVGAADNEPSTAVANGLFTVQLNDAGQFGSVAFTGDARWLEISVNGTPLSPRQPLSAVPYALYARDSGGGFWNTNSGHIFNNNSHNVGIGTSDPATKLHVEGNGSESVVRISNGGACGFMTNTALTIADVCGAGRAASFYGVTSNDILKVQNDGTGKAAELVGDVAVLAGNIGVGTETPVAPMHITSGTDTAPGGGGYIVNGSTAGLNISIDNNEIMARNNGATSTLYLNANGGEVAMGAYGIHPALAYGRINGGTATIVSASSNVLGVTRLAAGHYSVEIAGGLTGLDIPIAHGTNYFNRVTSYVAGGKLDVWIDDAFDGIFVFVIYRP